MNDNITVSCKVRPLIKREKDNKQTSQWRIRGNTISTIEGNGEPFVFDHIFDETAPTRELFEKVCRPIVLSTLNGINGSIFAYGQTSSGKTYTMIGEESEPGVVPLTAKEIFKEIENNKDRQFLIRVGYIEIYNEKIYDLLDKSNTSLKIFETQCGDVSLNYKEFITTCPDEIMQYLELGNKVKRIGDTNMNERSSRSHTIFRITIESSIIGRMEGAENDAVQSSTLNLVDLAGSERADQTGTSGSRLKEGAHINKSLLSLSLVIQKLSENADNFKYINYRDSKLTRILQASLGGNAVTTMICNITPAALEESYYTMGFAMRAKTVKNKPKVNEVLSETAMMKRLELEIKRLQEELKLEQTKNSQIKTIEIQQAITMRVNQIVNSQSVITKQDTSRRRTWCPTGNSGIPKPITFIKSTQDTRLMPPPPPFLANPTTPYLGNQSTSSTDTIEDKSPVLRPELANHTNPDLLARKVRSTTPRRGQFLSLGTLSNSDEFIPGEFADFDERSPESLARDIHTPCTLKAKRRERRSSTGETPTNFTDYEKRCRELEQELLELQEFTNLEKNLDLAVIKRKLHSGEDIRNELRYKQERDSFEERCKDLMVDLHQKQEQIFDMEKELIVARKEREAAVKEAEQCRNIQNSVQVEYEVFQQRAKSREKELIESLQEARTSTTSKGGDVQIQLNATRKELKQLEVLNYKLQSQLEQQAAELEKLRKSDHGSAEKLGKMKDALERDIARKDAKKLFRLVTKLRAILADEDTLLINTSIDTDELADSLGDSSFNSDSLDRMSPTKIVLTNDAGDRNVMYKNGNSQMLDLDIENKELKKKVKMLEEESVKLDALLKKYENEIEKLNDTENRVKELTKQLEHEQKKSHELKDRLQSKMTEFNKLTAEYDELSTQVMDNIQEIDNQKEQVESLDKKLLESTATIDRLNGQLKTLKNIANDLQLLQEKNKSTVSQLSEAHVRIVQLQEENETLQMFKAKYESDREQISRLESVSDELKQLKFQHRELQTRNESLAEANSELKEKLQCMEQVQEKNGQLQTHFEEQQQKMKQMQEENHDLTVAVQELSAKIVSLEEQIIRDDSGAQSGIDSANESFKAKHDTSLEMIKEERNQSFGFQEIDSKVNDLEEERRHLSQQLEEAQAEKVAMEAQYSSLLEAQEGVTESLKKELEELTDRCAKLHDEKLKQEERLQLLTDNLARLEEEQSALLEQTQLDKQKLDDEVQLLTNNLTALEEQKSSLLEQTKLDKQKQDDSVQTLTNNLNALEQENSALLEQMKMVREELKQAIDSKELNAHPDIEKKLQASFEELATLKEEKAILGQQLESNRAEQQRVEEKCENLCNELSQMISVKEEANEVEKQQLKNEINNLHGAKLELQQEGETLRCRIATLEAELTDVHEQRSKLLTKLQALEVEMEESSNIREHLDREVRALKTDLGNLEQQLTENNEKLERYQQECEAFQRELRDKTDEVVKLEEKLTAAQIESVARENRTEGEWVKKVRNAEALNDEQKIKLDALEKEKVSLLEQVGQETVAREALHATVKEKDVQLERLSQHVVLLENQLVDLKQRNEETEKLRVETEQQVEELNKVLRGKEIESNERAAEIEQLEQKIIAAQLENLECVSQTEAQWIEKQKIAEVCIEEQKLKLDALVNEKKMIEERCGKLMAEHESLSEAIKEQQKNAGACYEEQKLKSDALENEKKVLEERVGKLRAENHSLSETVKEKDTQLESTSRQVKSLENQLDDLKLENEQMEQSRSEIVKLQDDLEQEIVRLKNQVEASNAQIGQLEQTVAALQKQLVTLTEQLSDKERRLIETVKSASEEEHELKKRLLELMEGQESDLKAEKEHSNMLRHQISELERVKESLTTDLKEAQAKHDALVGIHTDLLREKAQLDKTSIQLEAQMVNIRSELVIRDEKLNVVERKLAEKSVEFADLDDRLKVKSMSMERTIKELEAEKEQLIGELNREKSERLDLANNQIPSLKSTIEQLTERQDVLEKQLATSETAATCSAVEIEQLTKACQQEKLNSDRLERELQEAKQLSSPPLQADGRPSLGDGKVAQALRKENEDLLKQLNEMQKMHVFKTKQLQDRIDELKQMEAECHSLREEISTMRHEASFTEKETQIVELKQKINHYELVHEETNTRHRSLLRQNDELRMKHQNLVMEMDDLRRIADKDRKSRRQSTHDDRRGGLFNTRDKAIMTEPSSTECSCLEMDVQIKELRKQLTIKDCQLNTQKMMAAANPLKNDVVELRQLVKDRESEIIKLSDEVQSLSVALDQELKRSDKRCSACIRQQRMQSLRSDKAVLTDRDDSLNESTATKRLEETQEELKKLTDKYQQMKRLCRIRNEKIVSLSQDIVEKENESCNANKSVQQEVSYLKRQLKESQDKYSEIQKLYHSKCGTPKSRTAERVVQTEPAGMTEVEILQAKYEKYKAMAISLVEQIEELKRHKSST